MGCKCEPQKFREEKVIYDCFHSIWSGMSIYIISNHTDKSQEFPFSIEKYQSHVDYIKQHAKNAFLKLEKKQEVRLNVIHEIGKVFAKNDREEEKENALTKKRLFFIIVLTISLKSFIDENIQNNAESFKGNSVFLNDIEQSLYNLVYKMVFLKSYRNRANYNSVFFCTSHLIYHLTRETNGFDNYISIEKYIDKTRECLEMLNRSNHNEVMIYKTSLIKVLGECFSKTQKSTLSSQAHEFIIDFYFSTMLEYRELIELQFESVKHILSITCKGTLYHVTSFSTLKSLDGNDKHLTTLVTDENFIDMRDILESFYKYMSRYTNDVTTGKDIFKTVEQYLTANIKDDSKGIFLRNLMEMLISFIFNRSRKFITQNSIHNSMFTMSGNGSTSKIILSSIFEYLSDKFPSEYVAIDDHLDYKFNKNSIDSNLNLFYEVICNYYDHIVANQHLNERYMNFFARIFIEDALSELISGKTITGVQCEEKEKLIPKLHEIISQNSNPLKLFMSLLTSISKVFTVQATSLETSEMNELFLEVIYKKLITFLSKYSNFHLKEKEQLDKQEMWTIITNFSTQNKFLKVYYIKLFIKYLIFVEFNFRMQLDFPYRKKIFTTLFEFFQEVIANMTLTGKYFDEFLQLFEVMIILMKSYSKGNLEDGFLIYKLLSLLVRKTTMSSQNYIGILQMVAMYQLTCVTIVLLGNFFQLTNFKQAVFVLHKEFIKAITSQNIQNDIECLLSGMLISVDILNIHETMKDIWENLLKTKDCSSMINDQVNNDIIIRIIDLFYSKYLAQTSVLNQSLEYEMTARQLNNYLKELNSELTFRESAKIPRKDTDVLTEVNHSVLGDHDVEEINDGSIFFIEERKSDSYRDSFFGLSFIPSALVPMNTPKNLKNEEYFPSNMSSRGQLPDMQSPFQLGTSDMDKFLRQKNNLNSIKL